MQSRMISPDRL